MSPDVTTSMQDDFGRVLPQTCADLYVNAFGGIEARRGHPHSKPGHLPGLQRDQVLKVLHRLLLLLIPPILEGW